MLNAHLYAHILTDEDIRDHAQRVEGSTFEELSAQAPGNTILWVDVHYTQDSRFCPLRSMKYHWIGSFHFFNEVVDDPHVERLDWYVMDFETAERLEQERYQRFLEWEEARYRRPDTPWWIKFTYWAAGYTCS